MDIKTSENKLVFAYETRTNLKNLMQAAGNKPNELTEELKKQGINPAGAQIWTYEGFENPDKDFDLRIAVPVEKKGFDKDGMKFMELSQYKYVETTHKGAYSEFMNVYKELTENAMKAGHIPNGSSREVYLNCDFENQANCVTEIQLGIQ